MKIVIVGIGAMGCIYAGLFKEAGHEVWGVDVRPDHINAIRGNGLYLTGASGNRTIADIKVALNPADAALSGPADMLVIATKAGDVAAAARASAPLIGPQTMLLAIQNGLGAAERIADALPGASVMVGVAQGFGAAIEAPGHCHHNGLALIRVGDVHHGITPVVERCTALWREAGFQSKAYADIDQLVWEKFVCNVALSGPCTVFDETVGELMANPEHWAVAVGCTLEAYRAGQGRGVNFTYQDPVAYVTEFGSRLPDAKPSMLQDHRAQRLSEIGAINGMVPVIANEQGWQAPFNQTVAAVVRAGESRFGPARP
ncbi:MAG: ketopantoate reductase family protein [Burkholderiaceae bacterium]